MTRLVCISIMLSFSGIGTSGAQLPRPEFTGAILGPNGGPLAGVRVDITTAAPKIGRGIFCPSCYLDCRKSAVSDARGRFVIRDLDPSLKFRLVVAAPTLKTKQTELLDPAAGPVSLQLESLPADLNPDRLVSGVVRNEQGIPIAGAYVAPYGAKTAERRWWGRVQDVDSTVTNADGEFSMLVPDNFQLLDTEITADGYAGTQVFKMIPGAAATPIVVPTGASVTGRLTRRGKPAANMSIAVVQTDRSSSEERGIFIAAVGAVTDAKGDFRFDHLPADQQYCIYSVAGEAKRADSEYVLATAKFTVPESGKTRELGNLEVIYPIVIQGRVRRIDDAPLPENLRLSFGRDPAWDLVSFPVAADGSFQAIGLPPETYEVRVADRQLAINPESIKYQMLSERSFGIHADTSIDDLVITVTKGN